MEDIIPIQQLCNLSHKFDWKHQQSLLLLWSTTKGSLFVHQVSPIGMENVYGLTNFNGMAHIKFYKGQGPQGKKKGLTTRVLTAFISLIVNLKVDVNLVVWKTTG